MRKVLLTLTLTLCCSAMIFAQRTVSGQVVDGESGEGLPGATVVVKGTTEGTITDLDGTFQLVVNEDLNAELEISYVGYQTVTISASADLSSIQLELSSVGLEEVAVIASVAIDRKTPVAVSTVKRKYIEEVASNQEFPELMKSTPGVYATRQGGGYGDSRISIRGFDAVNVAVMINGVPVNDMENGRVYWSNWAGLTDVTSSMQVQRGLGAAKVAVPSIGGTVNIVTQTTDAKQGGSVFYGIGNDGFQKGAFTLSTGLTENDWAVSISGAKIQGNGYVDGTEFLGYNYFFNISKKLNDAHILSLTGFGAPQRHGQRQNRKPIQTFRDAPQGIKYNGDWGTLAGETVHVEDNFYHKPQFSLNHYWTINSDSELSTALYISTGTGGGGGTAGAFGAPAPEAGEGGYYRTGGYYGAIDLDRLVEINEQNADGNASAFLRASNNDHFWTGLLSTYNTAVNSNFDLLAGIDLRYYVGKHYRTITNLLGADYYLDNSDINNPNAVLGVGDKYSYNNDGIVFWTGGFLQGEYNAGKLSAFANLAASNTSYSRIDYFNFLDSDDAQQTDAANFFGFQIMGGANYNLTQNHNLFANVGYFTKAPNFDAVIDFVNNVNADAENQKISSYEIGYGYRSRAFNANINFYSTQWMDRTLTRSITGQDGELYFANLTGVNASHMGVEADFAYSPVPAFTLTGMLSVGDFRWKNNLENVPIYDEEQNLVDEVSLYIADLKVGDQAQTTAALGFDWELFRGLKLGGNFNYYTNYFAQFDPNSRGDESELGIQSWEAPSFSTLDLRLVQGFKLGNLDATLIGNVNNVFDTEYIADAQDGSGHDAASALVYYALGRTWTMSFRIKF